VSQDDFEIVRRWYQALGDDAAFCQLTHPEIEWAPFEENHAVQG
jgi:ketosteroid isomerase-like protein